MSQACPGYLWLAALLLGLLSKDSSSAQEASLMSRPSQVLRTALAFHTGEAVVPLCGNCASEAL